MLDTIILKIRMMSVMKNKEMIALGVGKNPTEWASEASTEALLTSTKKES